MPGNGKNLIAFFSGLYYNQICKKNLPFKNFFYITPYLIIYTPLERPDSSPIGSFTVLFYLQIENERRKCILGKLFCLESSETHDTIRIHI